MRLIMNGEPFVYTHVCSGGEVKGNKMTSESLRVFLIDTLYESFRQCNCYVMRMKDKWRYNFLKDCDLDQGVVSISNKQHPDLIYRMDGDNHDVWMYVMPYKEDLALIDMNYVAKAIKDRDIIPVLVIGEVWCFDTNGKVNICGGQYATKYETISLLQEKNRQLPMMLSQKQLVEKLALSWQQLDVSIIEPFFDKDFHYTSDTVFYEMSSRREYLSYIKTKFDRLKHSTNRIGIHIGKLEGTNDFALLLHQSAYNQNLLLLVTAHKGRITSMRMCEYGS